MSNWIEQEEERRRSEKESERLRALEEERRKIESAMMVEQATRYYNDHRGAIDEVSRRFEYWTLRAKALGKHVGFFYCGAATHVKLPTIFVLVDHLRRTEFILEPNGRILVLHEYSSMNCHQTGREYVYLSDITDDRITKWLEQLAVPGIPFPPRHTMPDQVTRSGCMTLIFALPFIGK
jgi:hypothetical protein